MTFIQLMQIPPLHFDRVTYQRRLGEPVADNVIIGEVFRGIAVLILGGHFMDWEIVMVSDALVAIT